MECVCHYARALQAPATATAVVDLHADRVPDPRRPSCGLVADQHQLAQHQLAQHQRAAEQMKKTTMQHVLRKKEG
jgi:hypothetical protein